MIKLVIFDLDDTLIDKWNALFPATIRGAIKAMVDGGLKVSSFEDAVNRLSEINNLSENLNEAIEFYLKEINSYTPEYVENAQKFINNMDFSGKIKPLPEVVKMIEELSNAGVNLALVTAGEEKIQKRNFNISGLDSEKFRRIVVVPRGNKMKAYSEILEDLKISASETLIVGDRYGADLLPGKKLGTRVAWIPLGRGRLNPPEKNQIDYLLRSMGEVTKIVRDSSSN